jgi:hypothetical protein
VEGERPSTAVDNKGISGDAGKALRGRGLPELMVIALGARVSEDGNGAEGSPAKV